jgi:hypothetical protein
VPRRAVVSTSIGRDGAWAAVVSTATHSTLVLCGWRAVLGSAGKLLGELLLEDGLSAAMATKSHAFRELGSHS